MKFLSTMRRDPDAPRAGSFAAELLAEKEASERRRGLVDELARQAWVQAKVDLKAAAQREERHCRFNLHFAGLNGGYSQYTREVSKLVIKLAAAEGVAIAEPLSWNDTQLFASW